MITRKFRERYDFFRKHAGGIVGESARYAWELAKAEERAEDKLAIAWTWCQEPWYGDVPLSDSDELLDAACYRAEDVDDYTNEAARGAECLASLGMVALAGNQAFRRDPYARVVEAELFLEAFSYLDAQRKAS